MGFCIVYLFSMNKKNIKNEKFCTAISYILIMCIFVNHIKCSEYFESTELRSDQEGYCAPYNGKICKNFIKSPRSVW